jgi:hypothetical protein
MPHPKRRGDHGRNRDGKPACGGLAVARRFVLPNCAVTPPLAFDHLKGIETPVVVPKDTAIILAEHPAF